MLSDNEITEARATIARALDEDLRYGPDITTAATVPGGATTTAALITREPGVIAGVDIALLVLDEVLGRDGYQIVNRVGDGTRLQAGDSALTVEAPTHGLLTAERTLLQVSIDSNLDADKLFVELLGKESASRHTLLMELTAQGTVSEEELDF